MVGVPEPAGQDETHPFGERLRAMRRAKGVSLENFAFEVRRYAKNAGGTFSHIGKLERGLLYPTPEMLEAIAKALEVEPEVFPEYRLAKLRELFDERIVTLDEAMENARELSEALAGSGLPQPPGELGRRLRGELPSQRDPEPVGHPRRGRSAANRPPRA
jgi:transcriptional regulator with XRE-family HTH domain